MEWKLSPEFQNRVEPSQYQWKLGIKLQEKVRGIFSYLLSLSSPLDDAKNVKGNLFKFKDQRQRTFFAAGLYVFFLQHQCQNQLSTIISIQSFKLTIFTQNSVKIRFKKNQSNFLTQTKSIMFILLEMLIFQTCKQITVFSCL